MKIQLKYITTILFLSVCLITNAECKLEETISKDTIAIVNNKIIYLDDFVNLYRDKKSKLGLTDSYDLRLKYLLNLVYDELLIAEAKAENLDKTDDAKKELERIKTQEILNAFSSKHISTKINITDDELIDLFIKLNTKIKVRHLYAPTKSKADSLYRELINGKSFEELAKENFNDPVLKESGGLLGYISIDEMDPEFEKTAFALNVGEISKPVKTVMGYSIIKVEDIKRNPFTTENEFLKAKERLKAFARKRAYENLAKEFAASLRKKLNTKFNDRLLSKFYDAINKEPISNLIENPSQFSQAELKQIVVSSTLEKWNLKKLIDEMSKVPLRQRKWIHTKENLEDFIAGLINRKYIILQAKKEKLHEEFSYKKNVEYNFDTYLLTTIENKLRSNIKITDDSLKSYYEKNINYFRTKLEIRLSTILLKDSTLIDTIKKSLENGISFEILAQKYSIQKLTAQKGGDAGFFTKEELGEFGNKIFELKIGEWIGPLTLDNKFLFVKCTELKEPQLKSFEASKKEIEEMLITLSWLDYRNKFVESLKSKFSYKLFSEKLKELKL
ncbi:peptidylprolyl isomerase [Ignavibacteria bacterium 4148-Me]|uniref:peptidylprolyl isomerase n=1 Tax=Rosettibacter primus TaxID=3111523 RepID=UPI00336C030F